ncbi:Uncharacterised protein [Metamycoplasma alkalescens]|nr:Uncharacterised protein [Metamycoplasma alkalescens]
MDIINDYVSKFEKLSDKYKFTLNDINKQIKDTEAQLANLLSDLKGDESDMQAINELINILEGK